MIIRVVFFILMSLGLIGFGTVAWITTRPMGLGGPPPTRPAPSSPRSRFRRAAC